MINEKKWINLFKFILVKISYSFFTLLLLILSLVISTIITIIFFLLKSDANQFFTNFQYYTMIIYSIFLFIFVLMNAIKIFGTQIEDDSFLLLLTKPYSRKTIIFSQYLGLFTFALLFIALNIIILLTIGGILGNILHKPFLSFYIITVFKLFGFLTLFSLLVTTGSVTLLAFLKSQNVFLVFVIFCSLFLVGGLPYALISSGTDNIQISFKNGVGPYTVKQIKSAILFNENYKKGLTKYSNLTKDIANFYNTLTLDELKNVKKEDVVEKRIFFFEREGFYNAAGYTSNVMNGEVDIWRNHSKYKGKTVDIVLSFKKYFLTIDELKNKILLDPNNKNINAMKDLVTLYNNYDNQFKIANFMNLQKNKVPTLLDYDLTKSYVKEGLTKDQLTADDWTQTFKDLDSFVRFDRSLQAQFEAIFLNPTYILLRSVEDYIYNQVLIYHLVAENQVQQDSNFIKYNKKMKFYSVIHYFNFIEHLNQLWTYLQGSYGDFWFTPLATSAIDFDVQKNNLFSYPDFQLKLKNNGEIDVNNTKTIQNNVVVLIFYSTLCLVLFGVSFTLFMRKNIT